MIFITHTTYSSNIEQACPENESLNDWSEAFSARVRAAIVAAYPSAEVEAGVIHNMSGAVQSISVSSDGETHVDEVGSSDEISSGAVPTGSAARQA